MELKYRLYFIYAISFMDLFAVGLMFPLLNPRIRELGGSHFTVGLLGSSYSAIQVLSGPLIGSWSDIRGRKFVLLTTLSICAVSYILLGLSSSVFIIFILRIILGIVKHTQSICKAFISDLLPKESQAAAYGQSSGLAMLGFVIGPILGGHISQTMNGFFYVSGFTALLFVINFALTLFMPSIPKKTYKTSNMNGISTLTVIPNEFKRAFKELLKINWKVYWDTFLLRFLFGITISLFHSNLAMYITEKYNLSQVYVGYTISFLSIVGVICGISLGKITATFYQEDYGCLRRCYHCFCTLAACSIGFYFASNIYTFFIVLVPFSVFSTMLRIISMELMITTSKDDNKGSLSGASNSIMSIARFITPLSSGIIGDAFGENSVMLAAFLPAFCGALLCTNLWKRTNLKAD